MTDDIKTKNSHLITETRAKLTWYHSDSPYKLEHSLDDQHHPVLLTKNNSGSLTFTSACSSEMIFNLLCWPARTDSAGSLTTSANLLVLFIAFQYYIVIDMYF